MTRRRNYSQVISKVKQRRVGRSRRNIGPLGLTESPPKQNRKSVN